MGYRGRSLSVGLVVGLIVVAALALTPAPLAAPVPTAHAAFHPSLLPSPVLPSSRVAGPASAPTGVQPSSVGGASVAAAVASSPVIRESWAGLGPADNGYLTGFPAVAPPDVQIAVGPNHVVEMVNLAFAMWTKQGGFLQNGSLMSFFGVPSTEFISDPKVQYDAVSGRWFATVTDVATGSNAATGVVILAVSASSDPTGSWKLYNVPSTDTGLCLDQPILGVGASTVIVSVNEFSSCLSNRFTYDGARFWVLSKADLVAWAASPSIRGFGPYASTASFHPAQVVGPSSTDYLVSANAFLSSTSTIELFQVTGTPPTVSVAMSNLTVQTITSPPAAIQLGGGGVLPLDTGDFRVLDAVWSGGELWLTLSDACTPAGDTTTRSCVRLIEIDTGTGTVAQDFDVSSSGRYYLYPALRADAQGDLLVLFGYSSAAENPGLMAAGRIFGDPPGHLDPPTIVEAGTATEGLGCSSSAGTCRYGDYFGAAVDPSNTSVLWGAGEVGAPAGWGTRIFAGSVKAVLTLSYGTANGGSGYRLPQVSYTLDGTARSAPMALAPTSYAVDPGTSWGVSTSLQRSGATADPNAELWNLDLGPGTPPTSGTADASLVELYTYFHVYRFGFLYRISDNSSGIPPIVQVQVFNVHVSVVAGSDSYVDANSSFSYPQTLNGSTTQERWIADGPTNGTVTAAGSLTPVYYHEYRVTFDYLVQSASSVPPPSVAYFSFGANTSAHANATVWADAGRLYVYESSLTGNGGMIRIGPGAGAVGSVDAAGTITVTYRLQYLLNLDVVPGDLAGAVSGGGWYDAGSGATLSATAPMGWHFVGWSGAASGQASSVTLTMDQPANVTALFYPGLTIVAGGGGSVAYAYGTISGVVPAGTSQTVYAPLGAQITLTAQPSSLADTFASWSGGASGSAATTAVTLSGPLTVSAAFGTNVLVVAGIAGAVLLVIVAALVLLLVVRRRRKQPPA